MGVKMLRRIGNIVFLLVAGLVFSGVVSNEVHAFQVLNTAQPAIADADSLKLEVAQNYPGRRVNRPGKGDDVGRPYPRPRPHPRPHRPRHKPKFQIQITLPPLNDGYERPRKPVKKRPIRRKKPVKRVRRPRPVSVVKIADKRYRKKQVVVLIRQSKTKRMERIIARRYKLRMLKGKNIPLLKARVQTYRIPDRRSVGRVLAQLKRDRRIMLSQPNYVYSAAAGEQKADQSDPLSYPYQSMKVKRAHNFALGRNIKVAIIDTGVDRSHPALKGAEIVQYNAVDEKKPYKGHAHGTSIAGVLGAQFELKGIAPKAQLLDARAFFVPKNGKGPETTTMILLGALQWAYDKGAHVFNLSFEGPKDPAIQDALQEIHKKGKVIVAAAGNGGPKAKPAYPAAYKNIIATTAIDQKKKLYKHANRGKYLTLAAPGVGVTVLSTSKSYSVSSGTSIAAAHVSGLVALILEKKPRLSAYRVKRIIMKAAQDLGKPGHDQVFGAGAADAYSSLQAVGNISVSKR